jgi:hypothetical protein
VISGLDSYSVGSIEEPTCVVSLVIRSPGRPGQVLLGVRRWSPSSPRHPGVLSTMTMRIPSLFFAAIIGGSAQELTGPGQVTLTNTSSLLLGSHSSSSSPAAYALEALLARKLELGATLSTGKFRASAILTVLALEEVSDPQGEGEPEWTAMASFDVEIASGIETIPSQTGAYSKLTWVAADKLGSAFRSHDALILDSTLDPFEVCISGLCVKSAVAMLDAR